MDLLLFFGIRMRIPDFTPLTPLKYTGDESKGPRAANASLKNNHPVFIFPHHDSDGSQGQRNGGVPTWVDLAGIDPRDQTQGI